MTLHVIVVFGIIMDIGGSIGIYANLIQFCLIASVDGLETLVFMIIDNIIGTDYLTEKE